MGLFGLFNKKQQPENKVYPKTKLNPDGLPPQIAYTPEMAENCLGILNDCSQILQTTVNPDTFFLRLDLMKEQIANIKEIAQVINFSMSPDELFSGMDKDEQEIIYSFIVRYYNATFEKAETLKTDKGKRNQFQKFFDTLTNYSDRMNEHNLKYIAYKKRKFEECYPV